MRKPLGGTYCSDHHLGWIQGFEGFVVKCFCFPPVLQGKLLPRRQPFAPETEGVGSV